MLVGRVGRRFAATCRDVTGASECNLGMRRGGRRVSTTRMYGNACVDATRCGRCGMWRAGQGERGGEGVACVDGVVDG